MPTKSIQADMITLAEACEILGCQPRTLRLRMLQEPLTRYRNPIDRRVIMLDRREVESLLSFQVIQPRRVA